MLALERNLRKHLKAELSEGMCIPILAYVTGSYLGTVIAVQKLNK